MIWLTIAGMFAATYLPRLLPFLLGRRLRLPAALDRWLRLFPYAVLGALIFPGILTASAAHPWRSLAAGGAAGILAFFTGRLTLAVAGAIAVMAVLELLSP